MCFAKNCRDQFLAICKTRSTTKIVNSTYSLWNIIRLFKVPCNKIINMLHTAYLWLNSKTFCQDLSLVFMRNRSPAYPFFYINSSISVHPRRRRGTAVALPGIMPFSEKNLRLSCMEKRRVTSGYHGNLQPPIVGGYPPLPWRNSGR